MSARPPILPVASFGVLRPALAASIWLVLACAAWIVPPAPAAAQAEVPRAVASLRASVFRVVVESGGRDIAHGTGWAVASDRVMTNAHVVEEEGGLTPLGRRRDTQTYAIITGDGERLPLTEVRLFEGTDIALGTVEGADFRPLRVREEDAPDDTFIWHFGYPGITDIEGSNVAQLTSGLVQGYVDYDLDGFSGQSRVFRHDAPSGFGASGGPVVDSCGTAVGIHFAGLFDDTDDNLPGASGWAIAPSTIRSVLAEEGSDLELRGPPALCLSGATASTGLLAGIGAAVLAVLLLLLIIRRSGAAPAAAMASEAPRPAPPPPPPPPATAGATAAAMPGRLMLSGEADGAPFTVEGPLPGSGGTLRIGRAGAENDIVLAFEDVSRRHATVTVGTDGYAITDEGSTRGTVLNGEALSAFSPRALRDGDALRIAGHDLTVRIDRPSRG